MVCAPDSSTGRIPGVSSHRKRVSFAISVVAALIALYAVELLFTVASPAWIDKLGTTLRKGPSVIAETYQLRKRDIRAYPYLQPDTFTDSTFPGLKIDTASVIPLSGIPSELTVLCNEADTTIAYRSDSFGFRNPPRAWDGGEPDIALVGDSFAHGFCRRESDTVAGLLRLRGWRVTNSGLTGAGPLAELGVVSEYLAPVKPRRVFWLFYEGNDLIDIVSERNTNLIGYLDQSFSQQLILRSQAIAGRERKFADSLLREYEPPGFSARASDFLLMRKLRTATGLYRGARQPAMRDESREIQVLRQVLIQAQTRVAGWGGTLYLVYLPERRRFDTRTRAVTGENHDPRVVEKAVTDIAQQLNIPVLNAAEAFEAQPDPAAMWNARRYHYNREGYRMVADLIDRASRTSARTPNSTSDVR